MASDIGLWTLCIAFWHFHFVFACGYVIFIDEQNVSQCFALYHHILKRRELLPGYILAPRPKLFIGCNFVIIGCLTVDPLETFDRLPKCPRLGIYIFANWLNKFVFLLKPAFCLLYFYLVSLVNHINEKKYFNHIIKTKYIV